MRCWYGLRSAPYTRNQAQRSVLEVHTHTIDCRAALLNDDDSVVEQEICGYADYVIHTHADACYAMVRSGRICDLEEHTHTEDCYDGDGVLTCEL